MEFIAKYAGVEELTLPIANDCDRKIIVYEVDNSTGNLSADRDHLGLHQQPLPPHYQPAKHRNQKLE